MVVKVCNPVDNMLFAIVGNAQRLTKQKNMAWGAQANLKPKSLGFLWPRRAGAPMPARLA